METDILLDLSAELGYGLMESGGEIYRVEESVQRLLAAYRVADVEVFAIPNCITVSVSGSDGQPRTRIRRVPSHGTDIDALERYNDLCRRLCAQTPPPVQARAMLEEARSARRVYRPAVLMGSYFLGAAAFCLFFGGSWLDALCSGLCGLSMYLCQAVLARANPFLRTIACGAASALLALALSALSGERNTDLITIGALMLLVPGIPFTNAIRDLMAGDTVSGLAKTAEALLVGVAIALGTGAALWLAQLLWR